MIQPVAYEKLVCGRTALPVVNRGNNRIRGTMEGHTKGPALRCGARSPSTPAVLSTDNISPG